MHTFILFYQHFIICVECRGFRVVSQLYIAFTFCSQSIFCFQISIRLRKKKMLRLEIKLLSCYSQNKIKNCRYNRKIQPSKVCRLVLSYASLHEIFIMHLMVCKSNFQYFNNYSFLTGSKKQSNKMPIIDINNLSRMNIKQFSSLGCFILHIYKFINYD